MSIENDLPLPQTITFNEQWRGHKEGAKYEITTQHQLRTALSMVDNGIVTFDNLNTDSLTPKRARKAAEEAVAQRAAAATAAAKEVERQKNTAATKPAQKSSK